MKKWLFLFAIVCPLTIWAQDVSHSVVKFHSCDTKYTSIDSTVGCGLPFDWHGQTISQAGSYQAYLYDYRGCDSVVTMTLHVENWNNSASVNDVLCYGKSYMWNGVEYKSAGTYQQTLTNSRGCDSLVTLTLSPGLCPPEGGLNGVFSIGEGKMVYFSKGNLQYKASTKLWRFAANQYDYVGGSTNTGMEVGNVYDYIDDEISKCSNSDIGSAYDGWIDLFGYGTSGYSGKNPYQTSTNASAYASGSLVNASKEYDWGVHNAISNGGNQKGLWRTLTSDEWVYLLTKRPSASSLFGYGKVNGVDGTILLPDTWTLPAGVTFKTSGSNTYTTTQWKTMEGNGAVFLPWSGYRDQTTIWFQGSFGYYWSSTCSSSVYIYRAASSLTNNIPATQSKQYGSSVRLVSDIK